MTTPDHAEAEVCAKAGLLPIAAARLVKKLSVFGTAKPISDNLRRDCHVLSARSDPDLERHRRKFHIEDHRMCSCLGITRICVGG